MNEVADVSSKLSMSDRLALSHVSARRRAIPPSAIFFWPFFILVKKWLPSPDRYVRRTGL